MRVVQGWIRYVIHVIITARGYCAPHGSCGMQTGLAAQVSGTGRGDASEDGSEDAGSEGARGRRAARGTKPAAGAVPADEFPVSPNLLVLTASGFEAGMGAISDLRGVTRVGGLALAGAVCACSLQRALSLRPWPAAWALHAASSCCRPARAGSACMRGSCSPSEGAAVFWTIEITKKGIGGSLVLSMQLLGPAVPLLPPVGSCSDACRLSTST